MEELLAEPPVNFVKDRFLVSLTQVTYALNGVIVKADTSGKEHLRLVVATLFGTPLYSDVSVTRQVVSLDVSTGNHTEAWDVLICVKIKVSSLLL